LAKTCPNCGKEVDEKAQFCTYCGFTLDREVEETRFMPEKPGPAQPTMHGQFTATAEEGFPFGWSTGQFAGWWRRFVAWGILDTIFLCIIYAVIALVLAGGPILIFNLINKDLAGIGTTVGVILTAAGVIVAYILYVIIPTGRTGQTLGKKIMGIRVVTKDGNAPGVGKAFLRELIGKPLAKVIFYLGFSFSGLRAWSVEISR